MYQIQYFKKSNKKQQTKKNLQKKSKILFKQNLVKQYSKKKLKIYPQPQDLVLNYSTFALNAITSNLINIFIKTTLNNMFVTYSFNNKIFTKSIAAIGFKGKAKQTSYAYKTFAETVINDLINITNSKTTLTINLYVKSLNYKLKTFFTTLKSNQIKVNKLYDITPLPYNGCRKKKISIKKKKKSIIKFLSYQ